MLLLMMLENTLSQSQIMIFPHLGGCLFTVSIKVQWKYYYVSLLLLTVVFPFKGVEIVIPLKDVHAIEGTKAVLECKVSVPDMTSSKWSINDLPVKPDDRVQVIAKGAKQRLVFSRVHASDEGQVKLIIGKVETSCNLTVESKSFCGLVVFFSTS